MGLVIRTPDNMFREVEKRLKYRFWDKGRERSNRAAAMMAGGAIARRCPTKHRDIAYSGPPDDPIACYVCLHCHAAASEPELREMGYDFFETPLHIQHEVMDRDLQRQALQQFRSFRPLR